MALKENLDALKEELSAQEQLLESIIKSERFFKKHKYKIAALAAILVVFLIGYVSLNAIKSSNLKASNEAYKTLLVSPDDEQALAVLKSKNAPLYRVFLFSEAIKNGDNEALKQIFDENSKDVLGNLAAYQLQNAGDENILKNFIALEDGYKLLKEGKSEDASVKFLEISAESPLLNVAKSLEHYQPNK